MSAIRNIANIDFQKTKWITELRNKLCETGKLTNEDIDAAFSNILSTETVENEPNIPELRNFSSKQQALFKLYENKNTAGLTDNQVIKFSPIFTLIFGLNGSGKTSYYKILKDAFYSNQNIKPNIYRNNGNEIKAKIDFVNTKELIQQQRKGDIVDFPKSLETVEWEAGLFTDKSIKFCDAEILNMALSKKEAQWNLDKYKLNYYEQLKTAVENVNDKVITKISELTNQCNQDINSFTNPFQNKNEKSVHQILVDLSKDIYTSNEKFIEFLDKLLKITLPEDIEEQKNKLQKEASKTVKDYYVEIENLNNHNKILEDLSVFLKTILSAVTELEGTQTKINSLKELKESRDFSQIEKYDIIFKPQINDEPNQDYINLIKQIAETALKMGFENYPESVEKCFYCNQPLPEENRKLLAQIHELIDNKLEKEISTIAVQISDYKEKLKNLSNKYQNKFSEIDLKFTTEIFTIDTKNQIRFKELVNKTTDIGFVTEILDFIEKLQNINFDGKLKIFEIELVLSIIQSEQFQTNLTLNAKNKYITEIEDNIKTAKINLKSLIDKEYCFNSKEIINRLKNNLLLYKNYKDLSFQGIKTKITNSKAKTERELLRSRYQEIFENNLEHFEIPQKDKIKRNFSTPSGKSLVDSNIVVNNNSYNTLEILSEGEAKVSSLCDWLTELEFDDVDTLIFDDPITSLDHRYIKQFSEKLIELSSKYQVIVFTHNSEFYQELITNTIGNNDIIKATCKLCELNEGKYQCKGGDKNDLNKPVYKCGEYYRVEKAVQSGIVKREIDFFKLNYNQRIEIIRNELLIADTSNVGAQLRATINNFYEKYVLADIKREVFKGQELIYTKAKFKNFSDEDYDEIMEIHNTLSSKGTVHEPSIENKTPLDNTEYIKLFNRFVTVINKQNGNNKIELIETE